MCAAIVGTALGWQAWTSAQPAAAPRPAYRLAAGDVVEVVVATHPEFSSPAPAGQTISPEGCLRLLQVGGIPAEGSTCEEVEKRIAAALNGRLVVNPQVLVRLLQSAAQRISVLGAVRQPGLYPYRAGMLVVDAVAQAGGVLLPTGGSATAATLRLLHRDGRSETLALDVSLGTPAGVASPALQPGDTLLLEAPANIAVLGAVARPGTYAAARELRLSELLAQAGGPQSGSGDLQRVLINRRNGTVTECNLERVLAQAQGEDPLVAPGEVVYLPRSSRQAIILGCVQSPGKYDFSAGDRVGDLLALARGAQTGNPRGDLSQVVLSRADGSSQTLDLTARPAADPELLPGDRVLVPEARDRVIVSGYVTGPGLYDFRPGDTVRSALAAARGPLPDLGDTHRAQLRRRDAATRVIDLDREDPALQPDDEIIVPFASHRVAVLGQVNNPGLYECPEGSTLAEIIAAASGAVQQRTGPNYRTVEGDLTRVTICRRDGDRETLRQVNLRLFLDKGQAAMNPPVQPGDVLYVPDKRRADFGGILRDVLVLPRLFDLGED